MSSYPHRSQWDAYGELWAVTDEAARPAACDGVLSPNCTCTNPNVHADGLDEIMTYMTGFQASVDTRLAQDVCNWSAGAIEPGLIEMSQQIAQPPC